jgi:hypothetical protein
MIPDQYEIEFGDVEELSPPEPPASTLTAAALQLPIVSRNLTVSRAQRALVDGVKDGCKCPCCGKLAKVYRRPLNAGMAKALIVLAKLSRDPGVADEYGFVSSADLFTTIRGKHRDWYLLAHWGLIESAPPSRSRSSEGSGRWRPTYDGRRFIWGGRNPRGATLVSKYIVLYDGSLIGYEGELVNVVECLGEKFDYRELMSWGGDEN